MEECRDPTPPRQDSTPSRASRPNRTHRARASRTLIIAGPNGTGKTTFEREYPPNEADCDILVNADLIADGLSPFRPATAAIRAGRLMLREIDTHARLGRNFAFETPLAGRSMRPKDPRLACERVSSQAHVLGIGDPGRGDREGRGVGEPRRACVVGSGNPPQIRRGLEELP